MKFKITGVDAQGNEDSVIIEADTIDEVRKKAVSERCKRNWVDAWTEELQ